MSAGGFIRSKYELNTVADQVVPIRVQPETLTLTAGAEVNSAPAGVAGPGWPSAQVSGSRRGLGIHPRMVTFVFTGATPTGYKAGSPISLPALRPEFAAACRAGVAGEYTVNGSTLPVEFTGPPTPEVIR